MVRNQVFAHFPPLVSCEKASCNRSSSEKGGFPLLIRNSVQHHRSLRNNASLLENRNTRVVLLELGFYVNVVLDRLVDGPLRCFS